MRKQTYYKKKKQRNKKRGFRIFSANLMLVQPSSFVEYQRKILNRKNFQKYDRLCKDLGLSVGKLKTIDDPNVVGSDCEMYVSYKFKKKEVKNLEQRIVEVRKQKYPDFKHSKSDNWYVLRIAPGLLAAFDPDYESEGVFLIIVFPLKGIDSVFGAKHFRKGSQVQKGKVVFHMLQNYLSKGTFGYKESFVKGLNVLKKSYYKEQPKTLRLEPHSQQIKKSDIRKHLRGFVTYNNKLEEKKYVILTQKEKPEEVILKGKGGRLFYLRLEMKGETLTFKGNSVQGNKPSSVTDFKTLDAKSLFKKLTKKILPIPEGEEVLPGFKKLSPFKKSLKRGLSLTQIGKIFQNTFSSLNIWAKLSDDMKDEDKIVLDISDFGALAVMFKSSKANKRKKVYTFLTKIPSLRKWNNKEYPLDSLQGEAFQMANSLKEKGDPSTDKEGLSEPAYVYEKVDTSNMSKAWSSLIDDLERKQGFPLRNKKASNNTKYKEGFNFTYRGVKVYLRGNKENNKVSVIIEDTDISKEDSRYKPMTWDKPHMTVGDLMVHVSGVLNSIRKKKVPQSLTLKNIKTHINALSKELDKRKIVHTKMPNGSLHIGDWIITVSLVEEDKEGGLYWKISNGPSDSRYYALHPKKFYVKEVLGILQADKGKVKEGFASILHHENDNIEGITEELLVLVKSLGYGKAKKLKGDFYGVQLDKTNVIRVAKKKPGSQELKTSYVVNFDTWKELSYHALLLDIKNLMLGTSVKPPKSREVGEPNVSIGKDILYPNSSQYVSINRVPLAEILSMLALTKMKRFTHYHVDERRGILTLSKEGVKKENILKIISLPKILPVTSKEKGLYVLALGEGFKVGIDETTNTVYADVPLNDSFLEWANSHNVLKEYDEHDLFLKAILNLFGDEESMIIKKGDLKNVKLRTKKRLSEAQRSLKSPEMATTKAAKFMKKWKPAKLAGNTERLTTVSRTVKKGGETFQLKIEARYNYDNMSFELLLGGDLVEFLPDVFSSNDTVLVSSIQTDPSVKKEMGLMVKMTDDSLLIDNFLVVQGYKTNGKFSSNVGLADVIEWVSSMAVTINSLKKDGKLKRVKPDGGNSQVKEGKRTLSMMVTSAFYKKTKGSSSMNFGKKGNLLGTVTVNGVTLFVGGNGKSLFSYISTGVQLDSNKELRALSKTKVTSLYDNVYKIVKSFYKGVAKTEKGLEDVVMITKDGSSLSVYTDLPTVASEWERKMAETYKTAPTKKPKQRVNLNDVVKSLTNKNTPLAKHNGLIEGLSLDELKQVTAMMKKFDGDKKTRKYNIALEQTYQRQSALEGTFGMFVPRSPRQLKWKKLKFGEKIRTKDIQKIASILKKMADVPDVPFVYLTSTSSDNFFMFTRAEGKVDEKVTASLKFALKMIGYSLL